MQSVATTVRNWLRSGCVISFAWVTLGLVTFGQVPTPVESNPVGNGDAGAAFKSTPNQDLRFSIIRTTSAGNFIYVPERWSELYLNLVNSRDEGRELICATYFEGEPTLQFCRKVWIPARSSMLTSHPLLLPKIDPANGHVAKARTLLLDASEGHDELVKVGGELVQEISLQVTHTRRNTAVIAANADVEGVIPREVSECIQAARVISNLDRSYSFLIDQFLPSDASGFDCFDQIVIQDNCIATDFAAIAALRQWILAGGRLWVMLDRVDPEVVEALFADEFPINRIDKVGLTTIRIDRAPTPVVPQVTIGESYDYEEPVEFVRTSSSTAEVIHTVNGWPASLKQRFGDGYVFVTTLGPRGWIKTKKNDAFQTKEMTGSSETVPVRLAVDYFQDVFDQRLAEPLPESVIVPRLRDYVGYSIPSWSVVIGTMVGFCLLLLGVGVWLMRLNRLEFLGMTGSTLAVAAGITLLFVGKMYRHGIVGTIATIQMIQGMPGIDDVQNHGTIGVYQPEGSDSPILVTRGGKLVPDMTGLEASTRRMIMTDTTKFEWDNVPQPAGLRFASFTRAEAFANRLEARVTFDENGLVGTYSGRISPGVDALIASSDGRIGVSWKGDGTFLAGADEVFKRDQFLGAGLLSDEQNRRRLTMQSLLNNPKRKDYPSRPQLMFWTAEWDHGIRFDKDLRSLGAALVAVPLVLDRPGPGVEFTIPSPFLPYANRVSPDGSQPATMWNAGRKEWHERAVPGTAWLGFQVPRELFPLRIDRARIDLEVSGPMGRIEVLGIKRGAVASLKTVNNPVGSFSIEIDDADVLSVDADVVVSLGFACGDPNQPILTGATLGLNSEDRSNSAAASQQRSGIDSKVNYWRIESLAIQLWAKTIEQSARE